MIQMEKYIAIKTMGAIMSNETNSNLYNSNSPSASDYIRQGSAALPDRTSIDIISLLQQEEYELTRIVIFLKFNQGVNQVNAQREINIVQKRINELLKAQIEEYVRREAEKDAQIAQKDAQIAQLTETINQRAEGKVHNPEPNDIIGEEFPLSQDDQENQDTPLVGSGLD